MTPITVKIPETLFFDIVDLLREPKSLAPQAQECVLPLGDRNTVLGQLLTIRRQLVKNAGPPITAPARTIEPNCNEQKNLA